MHRLELSTTRRPHRLGLSTLLVVVTAALAAASGPSRGASGEVGSDRSIAPEVSVWVGLTVPALSSLRGSSRVEIDALRQRITHQQDEVMMRLQALGAHEQARVFVALNRLAVRLPGDQIDAVRRIPGVLSVRLVREAELQLPTPDR